MKLRLRSLAASLLVGRCASDALERASEDYEFSPERCQATVDEVEKKGKYTEEAIEPVCERQMKWRKCDFFAEALSLSSSHNDFNSTNFCVNMEDAHFCSQTMDKLLASIPVSDLAFGECTRATPKKSDQYCKKFQRMFGYAVQSEDLDTIRACYMIESYSNMTEEEPAPTPEPAKASPPVPTNQRIIVTSSKELSDYGHGRAGENTIPGSVHFGREAIVVKPAPLTNIGDGDGRFVNRSTPRATVAALAPGPAPATQGAGEQPPPQPKAKGTIVVEPVPAREAGEPVQLTSRGRAAARTLPAAPRVVLQKSQPAAASQSAAVAPATPPAGEQPSGLLSAVAGTLTGMWGTSKPAPRPTPQALTTPGIQAKVQAHAAAPSEENAPLIPALKPASAHQQALVAAQAQMVQAYKGKIMQELHAMFSNHTAQGAGNGSLGNASGKPKAALTQAKKPVTSKVKKEDSAKEQKGFFLSSFVS